MVDGFPREAVRLAARIAYRQYDQLSELEREAILKLIIECEDEATAQDAEQTLFHLREHRKHQLLLSSILNPGGRAA